MNHSAVNAAVDIVNEYGVKGDDIKEVLLYMAPGTKFDVIGQPFRVKNSVHASAGFSVQYNVANVLVRGSSLPQHFTDEAIQDTAISDFLKKVTMADLTEGNMESGRVKVVMKDGKEYDKYVEIAKGDPRNPISKEELLAKYRNNIKFSGTVSSDNAEKVLKMVEDLENLESVSKIVDLLVA